MPSSTPGSGADVRLAPGHPGGAAGGAPDAAPLALLGFARRAVAFWRLFRRNVGARLAAGALALLIAVAVLADWLAPTGPFQLTPHALAPPGPGHLFGTDDLGRDVLSGVIYGARVSLLVGLLAAATSTILGVLIGALAGFYGGWLDSALMRTTEFFQVLPRFFVALLVAAVLGAGVWKVILVIGFLGWPQVARLIRGEVLSLKQRDFVQASRAVGLVNTRILFRHVLPNAIPSGIVAGSLDVGQAILLEASLSFLGIGDPNFMSWGKMLNNAQRFLRAAWWMSLFPGLAIFATVLAVNLAGDGLTDAIDPRLHRHT
jgi:peptide/nickel transport system permease protein